MNDFDSEDNQWTLEFPNKPIHPFSINAKYEMPELSYGRTLLK
jgi:hypothetical protein